MVAASALGEAREESAVAQDRHALAGRHPGDRLLGAIRLPDLRRGKLALGHDLPTPARRRRQHGEVGLHQARVRQDRRDGLGVVEAFGLVGVLAEARGVACIGVVLGSVASLATVVPFGVARHEGVVPDAQLWVPPLVALAVVALTLGAAWSAVRRAHVLQNEPR